MSYITEAYKPLKISKSNKSYKNSDDQIINSERSNEILRNYFNNEYFLESQAIRNSFGKMVSTRNQTNPKYSFGKEERFPNPLSKSTLEYIKKLEEQKLINFDDFNNNSKLENNLSKSLEVRNLSPYKIKLNKRSNSKVQTDFLYCPPPPESYKFSNLPKWGFSKSERGSKPKSSKYDYYDIPFDKRFEENNSNKQWDSRIIGGDIGVDERFINNKNYFNDATRPGPGGYNPNYNYFKYRQNNYGYMGIKTEDDKKNKNKEDEGKYYNINCQIGSNINNYKFSNSPRFVFGTSKREKNIGTFKINESYLKYSSFGEQIMTQKDSRPIYSFGKQDRFNKFK